MKINLLFTLLLGASLCFISCGDDDNDPVVTISQPGDGFSIDAGGLMTIVGNVSDDVEVVSVVLESATSNLDLSGPLDLSAVTDRSNFPFSANVTLAEELPTGDYAIDVIATDNEGNQGSERVEFEIN